jgi:hypothetical protein
MRGTASNVGVVAVSKIALEIEKMNPLQMHAKVPGLLVRARNFHAEAVQLLAERASAITEGEEKNLIH